MTLSKTSIVVGANRFMNVVCFAFALHQLTTNYPQLEKLTGELVPAGIFKFFTVWTVIISMIFYFVCAISEIFVYLKFNNDLFSFRGLVFHSLVVPYGLFSGLVFWWLYLSDRHLVRPDEVHNLMPNHVTHILHSLPVIGLTIEATLYFHPLPPRAVGLRLFCIVTIAYFALVSYVGLKSDNWIYPFLQAPPVQIKFLTMLGLVFSGSVVYFIGERLHLIIWRKHLKED